jgi:hypothetical protein
MIGPTRSFSLPPLVRPGEPVQAEDHNALIKTLEALIHELNAVALQPSPTIGIKRAPGGTTAWLKRRFPAPSLPVRPYWPTLFRLPAEGEGEPTFEVELTQGYACERVLPAGDALLWQEADNHFQEEDPSKLRRFSIGVEQALYVKVEVLRSGAIGIDSEEDPPPPPVTILVAGTDQESTHYAPPLGDDEGTPGTYYYKICELTEGDNGPTLKHFHSGQNIDHWVDLPTFEVQDGIDVFKRYNAEEGIYETKGLQQIGQCRVLSAENTIDIAGNDLYATFQFVESGSSSPATGEEINFEDGLNTDGEPPAEAPADPKKIIIPIVQGISPIRVDRTGAGNRTYQVSYDGEEFPGGGNLKLSKTTVTYDSVNNAFFPTGSPEFHYWKNGLYVGQTSPFAPGDPFDELDLASPEVS